LREEPELAGFYPAVSASSAQSLYPRPRRDELMKLRAWGKSPAPH
jgi:hypothetical protein